MNIDELREKARSLPLLPGVYLMSDRDGAIIYVGKAKALKNRVSQYFQDTPHDGKTAAMVRQVASFDYIVVGSEFEALVLECALIKRHMPRYNILLKDDKSFPYLRLPPGPYPRFAIASRPARDGARWFGPYHSRYEARNAVAAVSRALGLPSCTRKFPRDIGKERPCLDYQLGLCAGWCLPDAPGEAAYARRMDEAAALLEGRSQALVNALSDEMEREAEALRFEHAAALRDRIRAVTHLRKKQKVVAGAMADTDVIGLFAGGAKTGFAVLHYTGGDLIGRDVRVLETPMEYAPEALLSALITQYYDGRGRLPRTLLLPLSPEGEEDLVHFLSEQGGRPVRLLVPQRGDKRALVDMAGKNAREEAERLTTGEERVSRILTELGRLTGRGAPRRIEAFDISNTGASDIVASMTVFENGKPKKSAYRRFHIKNQDTPDDYRAMDEVLRRRLAREGTHDEKFGAAPDLFLIDGGAAHAAVAARAVSDVGMKIPVLGMVKDDRHRTRALVDPDGRELGLSANPALFAFIGRIQEETHRFAVTYHHARHGRRSLHSALEDIPGVGAARRKALLAAFGSVRAIAEADEDALAAAVPRHVAQAVRRHYHPGAGADE